MFVLASINFPPIGELLNWKTIFFGGSALAFNKIGLITLAAAVITIVLFVLAGRGAKLIPTGRGNRLKRYLIVLG